MTAHLHEARKRPLSLVGGPIAAGPQQCICWARVVLVPGILCQGFLLVPYCCVNVSYWFPTAVVIPYWFPTAVAASYWFPTAVSSFPIGSLLHWQGFLLVSHCCHEVLHCIKALLILLLGQIWSRVTSVLGLLTSSLNRVFDHPWSGGDCSVFTCVFPAVPPFSASGSRVFIWEVIRYMLGSRPPGSGARPGILWCWVCLFTTRTVKLCMSWYPLCNQHPSSLLSWHHIGGLVLSCPQHIIML